MKLNVKNIDKLTIGDLLNKEFDCECGRKHSVYIDKVIIGNGVIDELPWLLREFKLESPFIVADKNTYEVAGSRVERMLSASNINVRSLIYKREHDLVPDERALGEFMLNYDRSRDVIIAVGSGVICDIAKYMSFSLGIPSIAIATAPSMDGYASDCSAFIIDDIKRSIQSSPPKVIIGDVDILKDAPMDMILAGLGDMLGKYSALRDWKLGNIILNEYYCDVVSKLVKTSVDKCVSEIEGYKERDELAIEHLMEGLVLVGIAMSFVGNSRPASGAEHHISHLWEMMFLIEGKEPVFHGTKVGIGTILVNRLAEKLIDSNLNFDILKEEARYFDEQKWCKDIKRLYKKTAPEIITLNKKPYDILIKERLDRLERIEDNWDSIVETINKVPSSQQIECFLNEAGAPTSPQDIGIDNNIIKDTIIYAKEVRQRYTILRLLWDMGLLDKIE